MRSLPDPGFAGDDGTADAGLRAALALGYASGLAALAGARLLVPVVAVLGESEVDAAGLVRDKTADMAAVLTTGADGRTALLAFSGLDSLRAWDPAARPVPVRTVDVARAALAEGADALVVDLAGPVLFAVETDDLRSLAAGEVLVRVSGGYGWVRPDR